MTLFNNHSLHLMQLADNMFWHNYSIRVLWHLQTSNLHMRNKVKANTLYNPLSRGL